MVMATERNKKMHNHKNRFWCWFRNATVVILAIALMGLGGGGFHPAWALESPSLVAGSEIFQAQCAGCHPGGGNILRRRQTLKLKALQRNGYDNPTALETIIRQGKNNMSAFGDTLTPAEIQAVAAYVLDQAQHQGAFQPS